MNLSQAKIAKIIGTSQVSINRYESGNGFPPAKTLLWYADYFDVSMDYIFGRTEKPQGKLYDYQPKVFNEDMKQFVEMCFDPASPMNDKLKQTLLRLMEEEKKQC